MGKLVEVRVWLTTDGHRFNEKAQAADWQERIEIYDLFNASKLETLPVKVGSDTMARLTSDWILKNAAQIVDFIAKVQDLRVNNVTDDMDDPELDLEGSQDNG